jgi:hypothetical protein
MSTKRPVGRLTATHKKDRSGLCAFTFADGRQCRTPRSSGHPHLCYFRPYPRNPQTLLSLFPLPNPPRLRPPNPPTPTNPLDRRRRVILRASMVWLL